MALVKVQTDWYGLAYDFNEFGDLFKSETARELLSNINPLAIATSVEELDRLAPFFTRNFAETDF